MPLAWLAMGDKVVLVISISLEVRLKLCPEILISLISGRPSSMGVGGISKCFYNAENPNKLKPLLYIVR